jgi:hypothetical protein
MISFPNFQKMLGARSHYRAASQLAEWRRGLRPFIGTGENYIRGDSAAPKTAEFARNLRIVASPVRAQQDVALTEKLLLYGFILQYCLLVNLAGEAPCRGEIDEDWFSLALCFLEGCVREGTPL